MKTPFVGGSYQGRSKDINSQRCINFYPMVDKEGGKSVVQLHGTPGLVDFYDLGSNAEVRNCHVLGIYLYAVIGTTLYEIDSDGNATAISGVLDTDSGFVWMADNGTQLMIVDPGRNGWIFTYGGSLTQIADTDFPTPETVTFLDGYFVVTETDSGKVWISTSYDGTGWDATDFATAERYPDNLLSQAVHKGHLWLLGSKSVEVWYNSGAADYPLENIGVSISEGIGAAASIAQDKDSLFFLNEHNRVVRTQGYDLVPISTEQIEYRFSKYNLTSDAIGYIYSQEGHSFYVLTFPNGHATWVYDITTDLWHERESYRTDPSGFYGRHRSNCYAKFGLLHIVGDYFNGKLYKLDLETYLDGTEIIRRRRSAPHVHQDGKDIFFSAFELDFEAGIGLTTGQGSDPQAMLDWSDDGGHNWSHGLWTTMGALGKYGTRAVWRKLGRSRNRVFRVTISDPVKVVIIAAMMDATIGVS